MNVVNRFSTKVTKLMNICLWHTYSMQRPKPNIKKISTEEQSSTSGPVFEVRGECYVQPGSGYVICDGHIIWDSMQLNWNAKSNISLLDVPSFLDYRQARHNSSGCIHVDELLHCRHFYEWNYYHFFMDVLPKVAVFESAGVPMDIPLLMGNYVRQLSFASETLQETGFNKYNWLIQDSTFIRSQCVRFCRVSSDYKSRTESNTKQFPKAASDVGNDRIYLTRGKCTGRRVKNEREIVEVVESFGFRVVDTNGLHILEQADLFRNARFVVAPHGAGLTNIQFREQRPLSLLELNPYHPTTDFQRICNQYGHYWSSIKGKADGNDIQQADYWIDPLELKHKVENLLLT